MSYSNKWCRDTFTSEQLSMFLWSAENQRADHIVNSDCPEDINGDGYVDVSDLLAVIDQWGLTDSPADVNSDGIVDISDLLIVAGSWGPCGGGSNVWTVDDDGGADFDNIQDAVDVAADGDEIIVYPGTYTDTGTAVVDTLGKTLTIHSSDGSDATFIDGQYERRGIYCSGESPTHVTISGFTIREGTPQDGGSSSDGGGLLSLGDLTLSDCMFELCAASSQGGGLAVGTNPFPTGQTVNIDDCTFQNNTANYSGAMMAYDCNLTMSNCQVLNNTGTDNIGGLTVGHTVSGYSSHLENITISENTSPGGALGKTGGLSMRDGSNVSMQSCVVVNNSSLTEGGGIRVWLPSANLQEGLRFDVDGNPTSKRSRFGGGYILISNCLVRDNITTGSGAGVYLEGNGATLSDSTVCGNTTDQIIGAYNDGGGNTVADTCP
jgi:hypothetical protein